MHPFPSAFCLDIPAPYSETLTAVKQPGMEYLQSGGNSLTVQTQLKVLSLPGIMI